MVEAIKQGSVLIRCLVPAHLLKPLRFFLLTLADCFDGGLDRLVGFLDLTAFS